MSENGVQGKIFGPKMEKVSQGWRTLLMTSFIICTLRFVFSCVIKSRSIIWEGHVTRMETLRILFRKAEGQIPPEGETFL
jgi:hypothetical protein